MKSFLIKLGSVLVAIVACFYVSLFIWGSWHDEWSGYNASISISDGYCNIAVLPITGDITTFGSTEDIESSTYPYTNADDAVSFLYQAENEPNIQGILVRIDSLGGYPVASEVIANNLKTSPLPSVALIRESGTSGGYLVATGADTIIASPFSDVGGIGITMSYVDNWRQNESEGLNYVSLSSAKYKDYLDPNKPLTTEERALIERDLKIWHDEFVRQVAENRDLPLEDVSMLADGSSMPGKLALENMLIDTLGDQETARQWFIDYLGLTDDEVWFCE